jgi:hypothetical protein
MLCYKHDWIRKAYLFVIDIIIVSARLMTQKKRQRGRPIGGKQPEVIRQYWRTMQQASRQMRKQIGEKQQ